MNTSKTSLLIGERAPDFTLPALNPDEGEIEISVSKFTGKILVLFFYPKDMTPGCTTEATAFSALKKDFDALECEIIGISKDSLARHAKFIAKHDLKITLAADEEGKTCESYGVWVLKKLYGREYMGIQRTSYLIGKDGKIAHIWPKVRVKNHAEDVLDKVRELV